MLLRITHETKLSYTLPVSETVFEVRMGPPTDEDQTSLSYKLRTTPQARVTSYRDGFGNRVDLFNVASTYRELLVQTTSFVRTHRRSATRRLSGVEWTPGATMAVEAMEFLQPSPLVPRCPQLDQFVAGLAAEPAALLVDVLTGLMAAVKGRLKYETGSTLAKTTVAEALDLGRGVCQDFSHLLIGACRGLGVPARYVSGYVNHPGEIATHAWCQAWAGDAAGWIDLDPTRECFVGDEHVTTAVGRDYNDVPPNRGLWKGRAEESMNVSVKIDAVDRMPMEWNEWNAPRPRGMSQGQSQGAWGQSQRQGLVEGVKAAPRDYTPYPHQRNTSPSLVQQQGEQQQQ